jgi:peptide/nickel transport system substrate-binding protein
MSPITRRELLRGAAAGGVAVGAGGLLVACGGSTPGSATTTATGPARHGGTLTAGLTGGSSSDTLDPNLPVTTTDYARLANLYDSLVWQNANAEPYLRVAEEITPNRDTTVWTIRLRKGVLFHDGREATADDLIFSLKRVVNPKAPGIAANALNGIETAGLRKLDRYTVSVPFSHPYSTLIQGLASVTTVYLLPVGFDPKRPIGTGPFKYMSFTPGQRSVRFSAARWTQSTCSPRMCFPPSPLAA